MDLHYNMNQLGVRISKSRINRRDFVMGAVSVTRPRKVFTTLSLSKLYKYNLEDYNLDAVLAACLLLDSNAYLDYANILD
jgi:hypothetical protein